MDMRKLLTNEHKLSIVRTMMEDGGAKGFRLTYDRRYGWLFSVQRRGDTVRVVFSVDVFEGRFRDAVEDCIEAVKRVQEGEEAVFRGRGPFSA